jgi:hypothetical protein
VAVLCLRITQQRQPEIVVPVLERVLLLVVLPVTTPVQATSMYAPSTASETGVNP